jgi:hypothetical protein
MAKDESIFKFKGTIHKMTFVRGIKNDDYVRAKRGTYKPAVLNDAMKKSSASQAKGNVPSQMILYATEPFRKDFKDGKLWNRLGSYFRGELNKETPHLFQNLEDFELHTQYPLAKIFPVTTTITPNVDNKKLSVVLKSSVAPKFRYKKYDGLKVTVYGVYPDLETQDVDVDFSEFEIEGLKNSLNVEAEFDFPKEGNTVLFMVKVEAVENGKVSPSPNSKGMKILKGFTVE